MTHAAAGGSGDTGNERDGGLVVDVVGLEELGGILLGGTTNLTDHDDTVGLGVLEEDLEAVNEVGAGEGVTADTDDERLTETSEGGLVDGLVGQGTGTGDDTDTTALVDEAGHDTDLALTLLNEICEYLARLELLQKVGVVAYGSDDTRAVRTDQAGLVLGLKNVGDADHVYMKSISSRASKLVVDRSIPCWGIPSVMLLDQKLSEKVICKGEFDWTRTKQRGPSQQRWPPRYRQRQEGG